MKKKHYINGKKSIFKALFVPLFFIMIAQACVFYYVAVYGGIEESLMQNETDILKERLVNRKNEIETLYDKSWTDLSESEKRISDVYKKYCNIYGNRPLISEKKIQSSFLKDVSGILLNTLRMNEVNGIYIILNDKDKKSGFDEKNGEQKMGICIRDLDQTSNYTGSEDLLIERAPASIIKDIGCPLDSWWAAKYSFDSEKPRKNTFVTLFRIPSLYDISIVFLSGGKIYQRTVRKSQNTTDKGNSLPQKKRPHRETLRKEVVSRFLFI